MDHLNAWQEAQISVIGSLLIDPEHCAGLIFQRARREQFSDASLLHVFDAAKRLWSEQAPLDAVTILHAAGGQYKDLLDRCMDLTPTCAHLSDYLDILRDSARLSAMQSAAMDIASARTIADAEAIFDRMAQQMRETGEVSVISWSDAVSGYLDRMTVRERVRYLSWGIEQLDRFLFVSPGKFVILAADSSVGKTALALQFAYHQASSGSRVGFFSLETEEASLTDRLMSETQVAGISLPRTKRRALTAADLKAAMDAGVKSENVQLWINNRANTVEEIRSQTIQNRFDVIYIDYVQLIETPGRERWDIVTNISIQLHRMAQQLGVTIIGLSQITPPDKKGTAPTKDDLRESRQLKHDADVILILAPSSIGNGSLRELHVAKNKDGPLGRMLLDFDAEHMSFRYRNPPKPADRELKPGETLADVNDEHKRKKNRNQISFEELPDDEEGGEIPF